jgi:hypothetical protein
MVLGHSKRLALDTNVLLDLAAGVAEVVRFFETSARKGYSLAAPATVLVELDFALQDASDKRRQRLSSTPADPHRNLSPHPDNQYPATPAGSQIKCQLGRPS